MNITVTEKARDLWPTDKVVIAEDTFVIVERNLVEGDPFSYHFVLDNMTTPENGKIEFTCSWIKKFQRPAKIK